MRPKARWREERSKMRRFYAALVLANSPVLGFLGYEINVGRNALFEEERCDVVTDRTIADNFEFTENDIDAKLDDTVRSRVNGEIVTVKRKEFEYCRAREERLDMAAAAFAFSFVVIPVYCISTHALFKEVMPGWGQWTKYHDYQEWKRSRKSKLPDFEDIKNAFTQKHTKGTTEEKALLQTLKKFGLGAEQTSELATLMAFALHLNNVWDTHFLELVGANGADVTKKAFKKENDSRVDSIRELKQMVIRMESVVAETSMQIYEGSRVKATTPYDAFVFIFSRAAAQTIGYESNAYGFLTDVEALEYFVRSLDTQTTKDLLELIERFGTDEVTEAAFRLVVANSEFEQMDKPTHLTSHGIDALLSLVSDMKSANSPSIVRQNDAVVVGSSQVRSLEG